MFIRKLHPWAGPLLNRVALTEKRRITFQHVLYARAPSTPSRDYKYGHEHEVESVNFSGRSTTQLEL